MSVEAGEGVSDSDVKKHFFRRFKQEETGKYHRHSKNLLDFQISAPRADDPLEGNRSLASRTSEYNRSMSSRHIPAFG